MFIHFEASITININQSIFLFDVNKYSSEYITGNITLTIGFIKTVRFYVTCHVKNLIVNKQLTEWLFLSFTIVFYRIEVRLQN